MLRSLAVSLCRQTAVCSRTVTACSFSSASTAQRQPREPVALEDMPFLHHGKRPRFRGYEKFKSPRKRASKLYAEIVQEAIEKSKAAKPKVWNTNFKVGDAIEMESVEEGGINATSTEKIRGVVLGIFRKGLDHSVLIRDVVFGEPVETRVPLHSPLLRSVKVLEENFVHKGKKKVKRAKLYYLSDRNPLGNLLLLNFCFASLCGFHFDSSPRHRLPSLRTETRVTKW
jgi:large subunit ribosomal protein L19